MLYISTTDPITIKVTGLARGKTEEQPLVIKCINAKTGKEIMPYRPCKSMRRVLIAAWRDNPDAWVGKYMTLVGDESVVFGGAKVGGIRISHVSGIDAPMSIMLTVSRSKRVAYEIKPIKTKSTQPTEPAADDPASMM